jgi:mannose-1-phosphate guanylyltransferase
MKFGAALKGGTGERIFPALDSDLPCSFVQIESIERIGGIAANS